MCGMFCSPEPIPAFYTYTFYIFQMPPRHPVHVTRTNTGRFVALCQQPLGHPSPNCTKPVVQPAPTTYVMADAIEITVVRQREQSGRLLPPPVAQAAPSVPSPWVGQAVPESSSDKSEGDAIDVLSSSLGGELYTPLTSYHVINEVLRASLSDSLDTNIRRGEYVNLQLLWVDNDDDDDDNLYA